jgi:6-phosphofructo-2-kinase / fructose-2,6-biphosphatase 2
LTGQIGGDADLSERGELYSRALPELVKRHAEGAKLTVWTSTLKRTNQTARFLPFEKLEWKALDELDSGVCDGLTYAEIEEKYPEDFKARDDDKYNYRYLGGESYRDVVIRLEPIIMELERSENILIVTHQAVLRCIYAYFKNSPQDQSPWMEVPLHTLIRLTPRAYGTVEDRYKANIPAVSTWRPKYSSAKHHESPSGTPEVETKVIDFGGAGAPLAKLGSNDIADSAQPAPTLAPIADGVTSTTDIAPVVDAATAGPVAKPV